MKFNHFERIWINNLLPQLIPEQSSRFIYKIFDEFVKAVSFTKKELNHLEMKFEGEQYIDENKKLQTVPPGGMAWNPKKEINKDIAIPEVISGIMTRKLEEMDKKGDLPKEAVTIFDKFVDETKWFKEKDSDNLKIVKGA